VAAVRVRRGGQPKNGKARMLSMTERLTAGLVPLVRGRRKRAPLFEGGSAGRSAVRKQLGRVQARVELETKGAHVLRHSAATSALAGGADLVSVQNCSATSTSPPRSPPTCTTSPW
jgi:integrase